MPEAIERVPLDALKPYPRNTRTHSKRQIEQIARSIDRFGFTNPVLVDDELTIIAGHGRVEAAKRLGLGDVPIIRLSRMSAADIRAYRIADNRLAELAGWDNELLAIELQGLSELGFDVELTGFAVAEIDLIIDGVVEADPNARRDAEDALPDLPREAVTEPDDVWRLGRHRLVCGDAREPATYDALLRGERADVIFTDPPYNVPIDGFAGGKGKATRREFAMASGEMSKAQFVAFLEDTLGRAGASTRDGAIAFVCMDWRHIGELLAAGERVFDDLKNVCVWTKTNGGMGSLYRSQHELVFVFKKGQAPHLNTVELGQYGRNRTNVWAYAGVNAFGAAREAELAMHPTVKPVALVEDAIRDVSRRGDIVLDPFGGSGSTLIAAERSGRSAMLIEIDPLYCDVIVRRFEAYTGKPAEREANLVDAAEVRS
jgi:DNA modification methylase